MRRAVQPCASFLRGQGQDRGSNIRSSAGQMSDICPVKGGGDTCSVSGVTQRCSMDVD